MLENKKNNTVYLGPVEKRLQNLPDFRFTWFDSICVIVSTLTYIADISTDILLIGLYIRDERYYWAIITAVFFILPGIVIQVFSFRWHRLDGNKLTFWMIMSHVFMMAPVHRYLLVLSHGFNARKSKKIDDYQALYIEMSDVGMLRVFESLLESAPQLVLQTYLMLLTEDNYILTGISAFSSLISLAWAIVAYTKVLRQSSNNPKRISYIGMVFHMVWRCGMISSRIVVIVMLATMLHQLTFVCVGGHFLLMLVWLIQQQTDFCETICEERMFNVVLAVVYVFSFFNVKEGNSRSRMFLYYTINIAEAIMITTLYWVYRPNELRWYDVPSIIFVWSTFCLGFLGMVIYYLHFHPKVDSIPSCNEIATLHFIKTCCLCHNDVIKKRAPPSESQSREKFNHIVHPVAVEPVQKTPKLISSNNGRVVKLPQKSPKKSPFHQSHAEKKTKSPKVANNGAQGKRVRPRNKHDEDWGVDLRNDGFQVQRDMSGQSRVEKWLDQHLNIMLTPQPQSGQDVPLVIYERVQSVDPVPQRRVHGNQQHRVAIRNKCDQDTLFSQANQVANHSKRDSVIMKLAPSNSFVNRAAKKPKVQVRRVPTDDDVSCHGDERSSSRSNDRCSFDRNNTAYKCATRRAKSPLLPQNQKASGFV